MIDNNTEIMTNNPYTNTLLEMGYDKQDIEVAGAMFQKHTFPCVIHGRQFDTEEQYFAELHEYFNGMWHETKLKPLKCLSSVGHT